MLSWYTHRNFFPKWCFFRQPVLTPVTAEQVQLGSSQGSLKPKGMAVPAQPGGSQLVVPKGRDSATAAGWSQEPWGGA